MPATSDKQRKFMGSELARKRAGKQTKTNMSETQLSDFASKVKKSTKEKPGRSLVDIEYHEGADTLKKVDDEFTHPVHKGYDTVVYGKLDPPDHDGSGAAQFTKGKQSCNRDIGQGLHYGAPVVDRGPETEFRVEEINPQHYGRDWEPAPWKDYFKTEDKAEELGIRREEDLEYQDCESPGAVSGAFESSLAYGTISFERIPTENTDHRTYKSQQKFRRAQNEYDERVIGDD